MGATENPPRCGKSSRNDWDLKGAAYGRSDDAAADDDYPLRAQAESSVVDRRGEGGGARKKEKKNKTAFIKRKTLRVLVAALSTSSYVHFYGNCFRLRSAHVKHFRPQPPSPPPFRGILIKNRGDSSL